MVDLTEYETNTTEHLIEEKNTITALPRPYLGMSQLGDECWRKLWYSFRFCAEKTISAKLNRIFQTGHRQEHWIVQDLQSIGIETWNTEDDQYEFSCVSGHCLGHGDGFCKNVPEAPKTEHLLEFKTANDKKFKEFVKKGCKDTNYTYYCQQIIYMHFKEITRSLFIVYNKNDSSYYIERIRHDPELAKELIRKAEDIITSEDVNEFKRIGNNDPSFYKCAWCDFRDVCFKLDVPHRNCRTCNKSDIEDDGKWSCSANQNQIIPIDFQYKGCDAHDYMDCLK